MGWSEKIELKGVNYIAPTFSFRFRFLFCERPVKIRSSRIFWIWKASASPKLTVAVVGIMDMNILCMYTRQTFGSYCLLSIWHVPSAHKWHPRTLDAWRLDHKKLWRLRGKKDTEWHVKEECCLRTRCASSHSWHHRIACLLPGITCYVDDISDNSFPWSKPQIPVGYITCYPYWWEWSTLQGLLWSSSREFHAKTV